MLFIYRASCIISLVDLFKPVVLDVNVMQITLASL